MKRLFWLLGSGVFAISVAIATLVFNFGQSADATITPSCSPNPTTVRPRQPQPAPCVVQFGLPGEVFDLPGMAGGGATRDRIAPDLLFVKSGTTVQFNNIGAPHRISIYDHGIGGITDLRDVTGGVIANVIQANATPGETLVGPLGSGVSTSYQFTEPGQYLVICAFDPHFRAFSQKMFIIVDETIP